MASGHSFTAPQTNLHITLITVGMLVYASGTQCASLCCMHLNASQGSSTGSPSRQQQIALAYHRIRLTATASGLLVVSLGILAWRSGSCQAAYTGFNFVAMRNRWVKQPAATLLLVYQLVALSLLAICCYHICFRLMPLLYSQHPAARQSTLLDRDRSASVDFAQFLSRRSSSQGATSRHDSLGESPGGHTDPHNASTVLQPPHASQAHKQTRRWRQSPWLRNMHHGAVHPAEQATAESRQRSDESSQGSLQAPAGKHMPSAPSAGGAQGSLHSASSGAGVNRDTAVVVHDCTQCHADCSLHRPPAHIAAVSSFFASTDPEKAQQSAGTRRGSTAAALARPSTMRTLRRGSSCDRSQSNDIPALQPLVRMYRRVVQFAQTSHDIARDNCQLEHQEASPSACGSDAAATDDCFGTQASVGFSPMMAPCSGPQLLASARDEAVCWLAAIKTQLYGGSMAADDCQATERSQARGYSRFGWQAKLGTLGSNDAKLGIVMMHPCILQQVFNDADSVYYMHRHRRRQDALHLARVPLWLWLEAERLSFGLLAAAGAGSERACSTLLPAWLVPACNCFNTLETRAQTACALFDCHLAPGNCGKC